jgi:plastocyanin
MMASANDIDVTFGTVPTIDGVESPNEWNDANHIDLNLSSVIVPVYFKHDLDNLYIGMVYTGSNMAEVYIDVDHDGGSTPQTDDFDFHTSVVAQEKSGTGTTWSTVRPPDGWSGTGGVPNVRELNISFSKLGITTSVPKTMGVMVRFWGQSSYDQWPSDASNMEPDTWANMSSSDNWGTGVPNTPPLLSTGSAAPLSATEDDEITFRVRYSDVNGHAPEMARVVLQNGTDTPIELDLTPEAGSDPWDVGRMLSVKTTLAPGTWRFRFNASDKIDLATGDTDWNSNQVSIRARNKLPELSQGGVAPSEGDTTTLFRFEVYFRDLDDLPADRASIYINGFSEDMSTDSTGPWEDWTLYYHETTLPVGQDHEYYFVFGDEYDGVRLPEFSSDPNWLPGPVVIPPNTPPLLSSESMSPSEGDRGTSFSFSITYTDMEADNPTDRIVFIDGEPHVMVPGTVDHENGTLYTLSTSLGLGSHSFYFVFNDSKHEVRHPLIGTFPGPTVVNLAPEAVMSSPANGDRYSPDDYVSFNALGSSDPDDDDLTFNWTSDVDGVLGDTSTIDARLSEGMHTITLTVDDGLGGTHSVSVDVESRPFLPHAFVSAIETDADGPVEGDGVRITVTVGNDGEAQSKGTLVQILVDDEEVYNDTVTVDVGRTGTVAFTWTSTKGPHTIKAMVGEEEMDISVQITENTPPVANPQVTSPENKTRFKPKETLSFDANAIDANGDGLTYTWDFSDGTIGSTQETPTHAFERAGTYTVVLNVTDSRGDTTTWYLDVVVKKPAEQSSPGPGTLAAAVALLGAALMAMRAKGGRD